MSGIVGSKFNIRGSGLVGSLGTDGQHMLSSGAGKTNVFETVAAGGGLTVADTWRLTTEFTGLAVPIASNWEQTDTAGQSALGSSMAESSGIFTFPSTGYYMVGFGIKAYQSSGAALYNEADIDITIDNSSYVKLVEAWGSHHAYASWDGLFCQAIVDVTDVANVKVRFSASAQETAAGQRTMGSTTVNSTYATFMRLADT